MAEKKIEFLLKIPEKINEELNKILQKGYKTETGFVYQTKTGFINYLIEEGLKQIRSNK